jgi:hypothetical protein
VRASPRLGLVAGPASKYQPRFSYYACALAYGDRNYRARRIKCDEGRPICRRCITSARDCVYNDPPAVSANASRYALILPRPVVTLQNILSSGTTSGGGLDAMHLDFFRLHTIKELPGSDLELPWRNVLFPVGSCEPVILDAIAALGCMHRTQSNALPGSASEVGADMEPYELYQKAVVSLRKYIDRAPEVGLAIASETTLIAIMLLFCFEVLCGNDHYATKHLIAAFSILAKTQSQHGNSSQASGTLVLRTSNTTRTDVVVQLFLRLASDWVVSGPSYYGGCDSPLQAICRDPMPTHFQSVRDASIHLDALCSEVSTHEELAYDKVERSRDLQRRDQRTVSHECVDECLIMVMSRSLDLGDGDTAHLAINATLTALKRWRAAFAPLVASHPRLKSVLLLEIQYLQAWLALCTINDLDQTFCDSLEDDFRRAVEVAEIFLRQTPAHASDADNVDHRLQGLSHLGNNLSSTICLVVEKCRDSQIRWRAIGLLGAFDLRGIFDTPYLVAFYQHLVAEEEMRAREYRATTLTELKSSDIPPQVRFLEAIMCSCDSQHEGEEFYKLSRGRMVYVVKTGQPGILETGQSSFLVYRDGPARAHV